MKTLHDPYIAEVAVRIASRGLLCASRSASRHPVKRTQPCCVTQGTDLRREPKWTSRSQVVSRSGHWLGHCCHSMLCKHACRAATQLYTQ